ncbi:MAG: S49 family peptidase [Azospirillum sp.]|nr:S49 family peptidase [Azospirillum sp.]
MPIPGLFANLPAPFGRRPPLVSVVRLAGVIGAFGTFRTGLNLAGLAPLLDRAFAPRRLAAVALAINSPGGSPVQSALIAGRIRALAEEKKVPVLGFVEDVGASGGYWLACAADHIYAAESSIVGSIGVVSASFGFHGLIERYGVERRLFTAGARKVLLDPFKPLVEDETARLRTLQAEIHDDFKAMVRQRRAGRLKADDDQLFSGEFWTGRRALDLGLIDGLGDLRSVLRSRFGAKVRLRVVQPERSWLRRRSGVGAAGGPGSLSPEALVGAALAGVEERALWAHYGL